MAIDVKAPPRQGFSCPGCGEIYPERWDASECCAYDFTDGMTRYECPTCPKQWDTEKEAQDCCAAKRDPVVHAFLCPVCESAHDVTDYESLEDAEHAAMACCLDRYPRDGYKCDDCGKGYKVRREAVECCHEPKWVEAYTCTCGNIYGEKQQAVDCCRKVGP